MYQKLRDWAEKLRTIIFDIDGTLANIDHRREVLAKQPINWELFFSRMIDDKPNTEIVELYKLIHGTKLFNSIIATGRPERYRPVTEKWLASNEIEFDHLMMRPDGDYRPDYKIKAEMLAKLLRKGSDIAFVVDDRKSVVDMWRSNNILCLQCADHSD
ncbi:phosphatase domain-containing protein [Hyphobacterium indicum]|uniref:phosphatase domain-containing protein n=1 Tax=Hyphobacterium indicum TaxID=2162714 RepID=UPI002D774D76|nr:HAD family acid phosphatase [Hyphobacterium indicum]